MELDVATSSSATGASRTAAATASAVMLLAAAVFALAIFIARRHLPAVRRRRAVAWILLALGSLCALVEPLLIMIGLPRALPCGLQRMIAALGTTLPMCTIVLHAWLLLCSHVRRACSRKRRHGRHRGSGMTGSRSGSMRGSSRHRSMAEHSRKRLPSPAPHGCCLPTMTLAISPSVSSSSASRPPLPAGLSLATPFSATTPPEPLLLPLPAALRQPASSLLFLLPPIAAAAVLPLAVVTPGDAGAPGATALRCTLTQPLWLVFVCMRAMLLAVFFVCSAGLQRMRSRTARTLFIESRWWQLLGGCQLLLETLAYALPQPMLRLLQPALLALLALPTLAAPMIESLSADAGSCVSRVCKPRSNMLCKLLLPPQSSVLPSADKPPSLVWHAPGRSDDAMSSSSGKMRAVDLASRERARMHLLSSIAAYRRVLDELLLRIGEQSALPHISDGAAAAITAAATSAEAAAVAAAAKAASSSSSAAATSTPGESKGEDRVGSGGDAVSSTGDFSSGHSSVLLRPAVRSAVSLPGEVVEEEPSAAASICSHTSGTHDRLQRVSTVFSHSSWSSTKSSRRYDLPKDVHLLSRHICALLPEAGVPAPLMEACLAVVNRHARLPTELFARVESFLLEDMTRSRMSLMPGSAAMRRSSSSSMSSWSRQSSTA
eukprot:PLAT1254.1.p1 GENE.PLAT1254.1~~PLAT1254.1.p1  ORF type:complete len:662 (+),score=233.53 PLAT1254.1:51-2036(+)